MAKVRGKKVQTQADRDRQIQDMILASTSVGREMRNIGARNTSNARTRTAVRSENRVSRQVASDSYGRAEHEEAGRGFDMDEARSATPLMGRGRSGAASDEPLQGVAGGFNDREVTRGLDGTTPVREVATPDQERIEQVRSGGFSAHERSPKDVEWEKVEVAVADREDLQEAARPIEDRAKDVWAKVDQARHDGVSPADRGIVMGEGPSFEDAEKYGLANGPVNGSAHGVGGQAGNGGPSADAVEPDLIARFGASAQERDDATAPAAKSAVEAYKEKHAAELGVETEEPTRTDPQLGD